MAHKAQALVKRFGIPDQIGLKGKHTEEAGFGRCPCVLSLSEKTEKGTSAKDQLTRLATLNEGVCVRKHLVVVVGSGSPSDL